MKSVAYLVLFALSLGIIACGSDNDNEVRRSARESLPQAQQPPSPTLPPTGITVPATPAGGTVHHYICPNDCEGSGGPSQANCPVCGTAYAHNQAFHNQTTAPATSTTPAANPALPEPAQNAAGVWHYTCSNGCAGGGGSAIACATCGATLVHNTAYHN